MKNRKNEYSTIKSGRKYGSGLTVIIIVIIAIVAVGIGITFFIAPLMVHTVVGDSEYDITASASQGDLIIDINKNDKSDRITYISIGIDGINIPDSVALKPVNDRDYPRTVIYDNIVTGIHGQKTVSIKATFSDGSSKVIWIEEVQFN